MQVRNKSFCHSKILTKKENKPCKEVTAVPVVCRFNKIKDLDVSSIVRKAMIKCGLNSDIEGLWKISQLKPGYGLRVEFIDSSGRLRESGFRHLG